MDKAKGKAMTRGEFVASLQGHTGYVARHRPILIQIQFSLFIVGTMFYVFGRLGSDLYDQSTWGSLLYIHPLWFWGAYNMLASSICIIGLMNPPRRKTILMGLGMHVVQFSAVAVSCLFYGGDFTLGVWGIGFLIFHGVVFVRTAQEY